MSKLTAVTMLIGSALACCLAQATAVGDAPRLPDVEYIGTFSDMRFTEEHAYGSDVELWKCGGELLGLFSHSEGLTGDTPTGILENISYDPQTQALSFRVKMTMGIRFPGPGRSEPSRDLFQFSGFLRENVIEGDLTWSTQETPVTQVSAGGVVLTEQPMDYDPAEMFKIKTLSDWVVYAANILRRLGPKW